MKKTGDKTKTVSWINYRFGSQKPKPPTTGACVMMVLLVGIVHLVTVVAILRS